MRQKNEYPVFCDTFFLLLNIWAFTPTSYYFSFPGTFLVFFSLQLSPYIYSSARWTFGTRMPTDVNMSVCRKPVFVSVSLSVYGSVCQFVCQSKQKVVWTIAGWFITVSHLLSIDHHWPSGRRLSRPGVHSRGFHVTDSSPFVNAKTRHFFVLQEAIGKGSVFIPFSTSRKKSKEVDN